MKCETCERVFPDAEVKVWSGKRVCEGCFRILSGPPETEREQQKPDFGEFYTFQPPKMSGADFFALAEFLGIPPPEATKPENLDKMCNAWYVVTKATLVRSLCASLGFVVTGQQASNIAANSLVGLERFSRGVPLTCEEREIAVRLHFLGQQEEFEKEGTRLGEETLWEEARRAVAFGEKGPSLLQKLAAPFFSK